MTVLDDLTSVIENLDFAIPCELITHEVFGTERPEAKWTLYLVQCCEAMPHHMLSCDPCWQFILTDTQISLLCQCRRTYRPIRTVVARCEALKP